MDRQSVFDRVRVHLLKQMTQSLARNEFAHLGCAYRGENDGTMCAIGCLIADEHFDPSFNRLAVATGTVQSALRASGVDVSTPDDVFFLSHLQLVHDSKSPEQWADALVGFAQRFGLTS